MNTEKKSDCVEPFEDGYGTLMTQIDCPYCEEVFVMEGDREGEIVSCPECSCPMTVRRV